MTVRGWLPLMVLTVLLGAGAARALRAQVLDKRALLARQRWLDNRDYDWFATRIPFFESPDSAIDATYYYRWELITKHLTYGDTATGYTFTEFLDRPFWSGAYGSISCPLGHQFYELRWLKDRRIIDDFARYWFETPGAQPRSYSNWYGDAMWATYLVLGDRRFIARTLPYMKRQYAGWVAEHYDSTVGLFHWDGLHDGMERNINSRQTEDIDTGADGYRPTLNSYMFADARAIAKASALLGDTTSARAYAARAEAIKQRVQDALWDPRREFFLHMFAHDEQGGIKARTRTYETGVYAGNPHGREEIGFIPWQFELPDRDRRFDVAWRFLMDTAHFLAPYGPTTTERHDPLFQLSPRCCWWSGQSWPYATTQTLLALANVLDDYAQPYVTRRDYFTLLSIYTRTQRLDGRPFVAEAANPDNGSWEGYDTPGHSEHYFHSGYVDPIITGLVGLRPRADDTLDVRPLAPDEWAYFALDDVNYHGHRVSILWDRDGTRYGKGRGLTIIADGRVIANAPHLAPLTAYLGPPHILPRPAARANVAVNNTNAAYPRVTASFSAAPAAPFHLVNGSYRYTASPPDRWTDAGARRPSASLVLDLGAPRRVSELTLYLLDDGEGSAIRAPASYAIDVWEAGRWRPAPGQRRTPVHPEGHRANHVTFSRPVSAAKFRITLEHRPGSYVGLTELEAWSDARPPLPAAASGRGRDAALSERSLGCRAASAGHPCVAARSCTCQ